MTSIGKPARNLKHKPRVSRRITPTGIESSIRKMNLAQLKQAKRSIICNNNLKDSLKRRLFAAINRRENKIRTCLDKKKAINAIWK